MDILWTVNAELRRSNWYRREGQTMGEKPRKRLVQRRPYLKTTFNKCGLYSIALGFGGVGCILLAFSIPVLLLTLVILFRTPAPAPQLFRVLFFGIALGLASLGSFWVGRNRFLAAKRIEPVELLTPQNTYLLPPAESLVRASQVPPSPQKAELLRAASDGRDIPKEQLLRGTDRQDN